MPLDLNALEINSLSERSQVEGSAVIKLLMHYNSVTATLHEIASTKEALAVQLEIVKANPGQKHLIVLHVNALDRGYDGVTNHYVGMMIEKKEGGAAGRYNIQYIDPMGRDAHDGIKAIIEEKLERTEFGFYKGRLQYAEVVGAGAVKIFAEGSNDYDCGPILVLLMTKAVSEKPVPELTGSLEVIRKVVSKNIGAKLREIFRADNGKTKEGSCKLADYDIREVIAPIIAYKPKAPEAVVAEKPAVVRVERNVSAADTNSIAADLLVDNETEGEDVKQELSISHREKELRERLKDLVLEESSIFLEEDRSESDKKKQEIARVFLELGALYLEEVEVVGVVKNASKLNEGVMFANYAKSIAESFLIENSASSEVVGGFEEILALAVDNMERTQAKLFEVLKAQKPEPMSSKIAKDKEQLKSIREYCKNKLKEIEIEYERIKKDGARVAVGVGAGESKESEEEVNLKAAEEYEIKEVRALYKHIAKETKGLLANIIKECEEILGLPPCKYSVIGLGSLALNQFTPYSDLEFAILMADNFNEEEYRAEINYLAEFRDPDNGSRFIKLEEKKRLALECNKGNKEYFRRLSELIHFRVISLGETVIPYSKFEVPLDQYIRRGISFDLGGKTPLGRADKPYELIQTPYRMACYLDHKVWSKRDKNLPFILEAVVHITGDKTISADYQTRVRTYFYAIDPEMGMPNYQVKAYRRLKEGIREHSGKFIEGDINLLKPKIFTHEDEGRLFDVKPEIYRLPDRLMYGLATYLGIIPESSWDATVKLLKASKKNGMDDFGVAAHNLLKAVTYATSLRLKIYTYYNQQDDRMVAVDFVRNEEGVNSKQLFKLKIDELGEESKLFQFFYIAIPLHEALMNCLENGKMNFIFNNENFFDNGLKNKGFIYKRLMQYERARICFEFWCKADAKNPYPYNHLAAVQICLGNYVEALVNIEKGISLLGNSSELKAKIIKAKLFLNKGIALYELNKIRHNLDKKNILSCFNIAMQSIERDMEELLADCLNNMALTYDSIGDHVEAESLHRKVLALRSKLYRGVENVKVTTSQNNLACTIYAQSKEKLCEAKDLLINALVSLNKLYGTEQHPMIANIMYNLGIIYRQLHEYKNSILYLKRSLLIRQKIFERPSKDICDSFSEISKIYHCMGNEYEENRCNFYWYYSRALLDFEVAIQFGYNNVEKMKSCLYSANKLCRMAYNLNKKFLFSTSLAEELEKRMILSARKYIDATTQYIINLHKQYKNNFGDEYTELPTKIISEHIEEFISYYIKDGFKKRFTPVIFGDLAHYYYVIAVISFKNFNIIKYRKNLKKAEEMFCAAFSSGDDDARLKCEYANYLISIGKAFDAIEVLKKINKKTDRKIVYSVLDQPILTPVMGFEINCKGQIEIKAGIYAYYLLIEAYVKLNNIEEAIAKINRFVEDTSAETDILTFNLVSSSYKKIAAICTERKEEFESMATVYEEMAKEKEEESRIAAASALATATAHVPTTTTLAETSIAIAAQVGRAEADVAVAGVAGVVSEAVFKAGREELHRT